jgi:hypothetical protein
MTAIAERPQFDQAPIRADLIGSHACRAAGTTTRGYTPVLACCHELLAAGVDPDRAVEVYRAGTLALKIRSIGEAANLTVKSAGNGCPVFALDKGAAAPPVRFPSRFAPKQGEAA